MVSQAIKTAFSPENLAVLLESSRPPPAVLPVSPQGSSGAVSAEVIDIIQDNSSGRELQGHISRSRRKSHSTTREPNAEELEANLRSLLSSSLSASSRRTYQRGWTVFRQFYVHFYDSGDPPLPLPRACIPLFISYLTFRKLAFSTISSYLSVISYVHKLQGHPDPTKSFLIQKLLTALSRRHPVDIRLPVTRPVLHQLVRALSLTNSSAFQRSLFSAMFLVAFYGLSRIGELTAKSTRFAPSVIQYRNLTLLSNDGHIHTAKITISEYKHNTSRRPFDIS